jgi:AraC-like DNA-binding protein
MSYCTVGKEFHPEFTVALCQKEGTAFQPLSDYSRFRIILVEEGTGILRVASRRGVFIAPVLFCLDESETILLERSADLKARSYYFHPNVINSVYNFENIRSPNSPFSQTEWYDLSWLRAFLIRDETYFGQLNLEPATARRIAGLFDALAQELDVQPNDFWPCRSRSFFLELLFLIERVRTSPEVNCDLMLSETAEDVDPIILYLHTHYQERITITELARIFHLNRTTLNQRFSEATGLTVMAYLIRLRMRVASLMLRDTTLPISEVMDRVGFKDITHFGRMFRKQMNLSPSEYRQRYCWMLKD